MGAVVAIRQHVTWSRAAKVTGAIGMVIVTALAAAWFTYMFTARLNVETAVQQQHLTALQQFEDSGARLDTSLSLFVDALLDRKGIEDARREVRTAITLHAEQVSALASVVGDGNVRLYQQRLGQLRRYADETDSTNSAMTMAQEHVYLMASRKKLAELARKNIYP